MEDQITKAQSFAVAGFVLAVLTGLILYSAIGPGSTNRRTSLGFDFSIAPKASAWQPNPTDYCANIGVLTGPLLAPVSVALLVDAAPNIVAHDATWAFYRDLVAGRSTSDDLSRVQAAYSCPPG